MRRPLLVLLLLPLGGAVQAQSPDERRSSVEYVKKLQQPDGGFAPAAGGKKSSLRATSAAVRALKYFGGEAADARAAAAFVDRCFDAKRFGFADAPGGKLEVPATAVGLMAIKALGMDEERYRDAGLLFLVENARGFEEVRIAVAGVEAVDPARSRIPEPVLVRWASALLPTALDARTLAGSAVGLMRVGMEPDKLPRAKQLLPTLLAAQRDDGGFGREKAKGSDLDTTYRVGRAFHMLKKSPKDVARLRAFVASCRNADGGYGVEPGQPSSVAATYFAASVLHWFGDAK
jgi:hypothetical protein